MKSIHNKKTVIILFSVYVFYENYVYCECKNWHKVICKIQNTWGPLQMCADAYHQWLAMNQAAHPTQQLLSYKNLEFLDTFESSKNTLFMSGATSAGMSRQAIFYILYILNTPWYFCCRHCSKWQNVWIPPHSEHHSSPQKILELDVDNCISFNITAVVFLVHISVP